MRKSGFTLIELIVVMAIISILVLLGVPKYKEYTNEAHLTKIKVNVKELESASMQYYMKNNAWPRLTDDAYTSEQIEDFGQEILDKTGVVVSLESDGNYYDIDYEKISNYIKKPEDKVNYILQNPIGSVFYIDGITKEAKARLSVEVPKYDYVLATDEDFSGTTNGSFMYIGTDEYVEVPHVIKGVPVTSYSQMFRGTSVKGVKSTNTNVTTMVHMFRESYATELDLSNLETSNVTNMSYMFANSSATTLNLSNFNTSKVTSMLNMFQNSRALVLDLGSFDTSNVTDMSYMFAGSKATTLDLSSFDTSKVTYMSSMFMNSKATTGYARTLSDAYKLNKSSYKPSSLTFVVK